MKNLPGPAHSQPGDFLFLQLLTDAQRLPQVNRPKLM
jgi:hypothetical protein